MRKLKGVAAVFWQFKDAVEGEPIKRVVSSFEGADCSFLWPVLVARWLRQMGAVNAIGRNSALRVPQIENTRKGWPGISKHRLLHVRPTEGSHAPDVSRAV